MSVSEFEKYKKIMAKIQAKLSMTQKIEMYGLGIVGGRGKCTAKKPFTANVIAYAKWRAWKKYEHLTQEEAQEQFVAKAKLLLKSLTSRL